MDVKVASCFCTIFIGIAIIVFAWWKLSWAPIALTVLGVLVILKGIINKCCCSKDDACQNIASS